MRNLTHLDCEIISGGLSEDAQRYATIVPATAAAGALGGCIGGCVIVGPLWFLPALSGCVGGAVAAAVIVAVWNATD